MVCYIEEVKEERGHVGLGKRDLGKESKIVSKMLKT